MYGSALAFAEFPMSSTPLPEKSAQKAETWLPSLNRSAPQDTYLQSHTRFVQCVGVTGGAIEKFAAPSSSQEPTASDFEEDSPAVRTANARSVLLATKYAEGFQSREQAVRLEILTTRLRKLAPRITENDWTAIENAAAHVEQVDDRLQAIRARFVQS